MSETPELDKMVASGIMHRALQDLKEATKARTNKRSAEMIRRAIWRLDMAAKELEQAIDTD